MTMKSSSTAVCFVSMMTIITTLMVIFIIASPSATTAFAPSIGTRHSSFQQARRVSSTGTSNGALSVSPFPYQEVQHQRYHDHHHTLEAATALIPFMEQHYYSNNNKPKNLYSILDASMDDSPTTLKRKYVALAKKSHPDMATDSSIDFSEVAAAYAVLSDPKQRRKYDRQLLATDWTELLCYLVGGLTEFFVLFLQVILLPLSQEMFTQNGGASSTTNTADKHYHHHNYEEDATELFFATLVA